MTTEIYIPIKTLCSHYKVETSFFQGLNEYGLIEITSVEQSPCVHKNNIKGLEAMIRLHHDLDINFEGIDTVLNLLEKINDLQEELVATKNRLRIFEE
ncbi:MerR-like DNA binding protein [Gelidibacter algens]|jgi:hypothetical protein|uniref:MerR-like DNA binding protein n=1 Tax=Gelidibacter algens TaxID=49280 RepID=A0A327RSW0_9FLAO|nr:chaperone modulator CbpM [Gelidibacter algens]RAJ19118.1 MerR-like DNA binding protein [Gelidibacter algens]